MEDKALYRPILWRSLQITRRFKSLWIFGLFAAILGSGGEYEIITRLFYNPADQSDIITNFVKAFQNGLGNNGNFFGNLASAITSDPLGFAILAAIIIVTCALMVFFFWTAIISQIGLTTNIASINRNRRPTLNEGIEAGTRNFWPITLINIVFKAITFLLLLALGSQILSLTTWGIAGKAIYAIVFVICIVIIFTFDFLSKYQMYFIILKKQALRPALKSAWELLRRSWLISIEMSLILFIVYALAVFVVLLVGTVVLAIPFVLGSYYSISPYIILGLSLLSLVVLFIFSVLITALLITFRWASWTILFNRLVGGEPVSKIVRSSQTIPQYFEQRQQS